MRLTTFAAAALAIVGWFCILDHRHLIVAVTGDVGTAASYQPPYLPTSCPGYSSRDQLPDGGLFAAVNRGIWDNGAACGRKYRLRCLSGLRRPCKDGGAVVVVEVVDVCRNSPCPATLLLSDTAFNSVSRIPNTKINVEYAQI